MNGDVGTAIEHGGLKFFYEQPFATDLGQWRIQNFVTLSGEGHQLNLKLRMECDQAGFNVLGLPQGQRTLTGGYS